MNKTEGLGLAAASAGRLAGVNARNESGYSS